jgi:hypothetical protein
MKIRKEIFTLSSVIFLSGTKNSFINHTIWTN